jgi:uncharacterized protein DUF2442
MPTSPPELDEPRVKEVAFEGNTLIFRLHDGRSLTAPLDWYPRLLNGRQEERDHWRLIARGVGVHWPDLDEDISVENLLNGKRSLESPRSFARWLEKRAAKTQHS